MEELHTPYYFVSPSRSKKLPITSCCLTIDNSEAVKKHTVILQSNMCSHKKNLKVILVQIIPIFHVKYDLYDLNYTYTRQVTGTAKTPACVSKCC